MGWGKALNKNPKINCKGFLQNNLCFRGDQGDMDDTRKEQVNYMENNGKI